MSNNLVLYKPLFRLNANGHGGEKRSSQVFHLLQPLQPQLYADVRIPQQEQGNSLSGLKEFLAFVYWLKVIRKSPIIFSVQFFKKLYQAYKLLNFLKPAVVVLENTNLADYYIAEAAKYCKSFVCIIPHNIESLVATQFSPYTQRQSPHWLEEEMAFLRKADVVYAISKYDRWLFSCNNINTKLLPYFPATDVLQNLLHIRQQRENLQNPLLILILGTVKNHPTREGLRQLTNFLETNNSHPDLSYALAGYNVEKHFDAALYKNVQIRGSVSGDDLNQLLRDCKCVLIHHQPSSGALTRVTECLIAGIPVSVIFLQ